MVSSLHKFTSALPSAFNVWEAKLAEAIYKINRHSRGGSRRRIKRDFFLNTLVSRSAGSERGENGSKMEAFET